MLAHYAFLGSVPPWLQLFHHHFPSHILHLSHLHHHLSPSLLLIPPLLHLLRLECSLDSLAVPLASPRILRRPLTSLTYRSLIKTLPTYLFTKQIYPLAWLDAPTVEESAKAVEDSPCIVVVAPVDHNRQTPPLPLPPHNLPLLTYLHPVISPTLLLSSFCHYLVAVSSVHIAHGDTTLTASRPVWSRLSAPAMTLPPSWQLLVCSSFLV